MAPGKGYILMTDFTTHPKGFPKIGTVIRDCLRPTSRWLSEPTEDVEVLTHSDVYKQVRSPEFDLHGGIWAEFCKQVELKLGGGTSSHVVHTYHAQRLDTLYPKRPLSDKSVRERVQGNEDIEAAMGIGNFSFSGGRPVFVVTGLKIARGFKHTTEDKTQRHLTAAAGAGAPSGSAGAGANFSVAQGNKFEESAETLKGKQNDIVFAYRLDKITPRGWKARKLSISAHEPDGAFSSASDRQTRDEGLELSSVSLQDILQAAEDNEDTVSSSLVTERDGSNNDEVFCVSFEEDE